MRCSEPAAPTPRPPRHADLAADRARRTANVDRWLASLLGTSPGAALVALGSYGRSELLPGSDLDVLLLHTGRPDIADLADQVWYPVWDSGAHLDHAVRTVAEARDVACRDLRAALGMLHARHVAGDPALTRELRLGMLSDWRAGAWARLDELQELRAQRTQRCGELAFLLEPDLKEARGGLRDALSIHAVAAAWVAPGPGPQVRAAREFILDARHALHRVTGRATDRLVLQEQDEVAEAVGVADADTLMRHLAGSGRTVAYALDSSLRQARRSRPSKSGVRRDRHGVARARSSAPRRPLADGLVEQDGEVVLARAADPAGDPVLVLRAAAAAAQAGLPLAPRALARLHECPPLPAPWPAGARDCLTALLGSGPAAISVWEALDQEGIVVGLLPDWDRVRNRPQRDPLHAFTVDRHLVETAARAAALTRDVSRPDLLLVAALLHDIGKGWPGDHQVTGEVVARDTARRMGFSDDDVEMVAGAVRHHLLLPRTAVRRDLDDPATAAQVATVVGTRGTLELLHALAIADGQATGPAAWNDWKAGLVAGLVRRTGAVLAGAPLPQPLPLRADQQELATVGVPGAMFTMPEVTVVAPDGPGLLWKAAGVLAVHRLAVRSANATSHNGMAVTAFTVTCPYGEPPDPKLVASDLRRALAGELDITQRLVQATAVHDQRSRPSRTAPPKVKLLDDASQTATVVEVRAHDSPGLLARVGQALDRCGLDIRAARVETLGAEAVDVFYVTDTAGSPVTDLCLRHRITAEVLAALSDCETSGSAPRNG
ncbi:MAG TPA: [protein-PII] uridylyltransferase [Streptosporangiaceae bacterium]|nr:[protein-PII] uridylyltransferase [Streptosporangiaceae bacterium]